MNTIAQKQKAITTNTCQIDLLISTEVKVKKML